ncbi:PAS domain-containing sensor histidine kinase [Halorientalis halophila]|uniref:PAS domain-containing sensor histidine kinase n=1 Tax=Halorientalis halophila TaxID=3108499 RepID=UPI00300A13D3
MSQGADDAGEWQCLLEDLPVMYVHTRKEDGQAVLDTCNERFVETLGYDREALLGRPLADVYTPESAAAMDGCDSLAAPDDETVTRRRKLVCADGTVVHTLVRAVPRTDADDAIVGARILFVDITMREQRRRQATVLNRLLRHNLRNDMTVVLSHARLLADAMDESERDSAQKVREIAERWDRLVEKVQRIRQVLSPEQGWRPADLATVLERVEADLNQRYPAARVHVLRPSEGVATIRPEVELALTELCSNAIRHAEAEDPEVVVTVGVPPDEPWVKLTVTDDGPPIPESELLALRDDETTPLVHGTGLGLWMVRLAVERVGGHVAVTENDENGTAVTIRYPCRD